MTDAAEIGNASWIRASAWNRQKIFQGRYTRGETRTLIIDFNGALPPGVTITACTFKMAQPYIVFMANPAFRADQRAVQIDITCNYPNDTMFKCTATDSTGKQWVQTARLQVDDTYWFDLDTIQATGPTVLSIP